MTTILAFAGEKESGKDTCVNFLLRNAPELWPGKIVKQYSFAEPLKRMCIDLLGLTEEQCYGTNAQKDSFSKVQWENLPHYPELCERAINEGRSPPAGLMTAREVLQHVGTEIFRRMNSTCWTESLIRTVKKEEPFLALISDCRFKNELDLIHGNSGYSIKLTRSVHKGDKHASESAIKSLPTLAVLNNAIMNIEESNTTLTYILKDWEIL